MRYQNVEFARNRSVFIDTTNSTNPTEATFQSKSVLAQTKNGGVAMVKGSCTVRQEATTTTCGSECPVSVVESVDFNFSVLKGASNLSALRVELIRLLDIAITDYSLTAGLVPPVQANFEA